MPEEGEHAGVRDDAVDEGQGGRQSCPRKTRKKKKDRG